jgi:hypothetical protein
VPEWVLGWLSGWVAGWLVVCVFALVGQGGGWVRVRRVLADTSDPEPPVGVGGRECKRPGSVYAWALSCLLRTSLLSDSP